MTKPIPKSLLILPLEKRADGWWITKCLSREYPDCGPYDTKAEAEEIRRGLRRFCEENPDYVDLPAPAVGPDKEIEKHDDAIIESGRVSEGNERQAALFE